MVIRVLLTVETLAWHRGTVGLPTIVSRSGSPSWPWCVQWLTLCRNAWTRRPPTWWLPRHTSKRRHQIADATFRWRSRRPSGVGADAAVEADPILPARQVHRAV